MENIEENVLYQENLVEEMVAADNSDSNEDGYKPRNAVVAAKENLYDRANISVEQVDKFIFICMGAICLLIVGGILLH